MLALSDCQSKVDVSDEIWSEYLNSLSPETIDEYGICRERLRLYKADGKVWLRFGYTECTVDVSFVQSFPGHHPMKRLVNEVIALFTDKP